MISFVLLKYNILTSNSSTWHLCDTYPREVRSKWAWRCAADCEHLAKGHPESEKCIEVAKEFRDGLATRRAIDAAISALRRADDPAVHFAVHAAHAAYYAATSICDDASHLTTHAAASAAYSTRAASDVNEQARKWDLYLSWLIEELGAWEQARG